MLTLGKFVQNTQKKEDLYEIWKYVDINLNKKVSLDILLITLPCNGFGDIVFAMKFEKILYEWYPESNIKIITTQPDNFEKLGYDINSLYYLEAEDTQCRKLSGLNLATPIKEEKFDLIFISPLTADFDPDLSDVQSLLPYATKFNTFFLSEYNSPLNKKIDFHMGVGENRLGIFLEKNKQSCKNIIKLKNYSVVYVAETIPRVSKCVAGFCEMFAKKYNRKNASLLFPPWMFDRYLNKIFLKVSPYIKNIYIFYREGTKKIKHKYLGFGKSGTLSLRFDIFPVSYEKMKTIIYHSLPDILITGDQSLSDAISCSKEKTIYYQIAPWKENLALNLAKYLPNMWLLSKITTCGNLETIKYKGNYKNFKKTWDFKKLAKPYFDKLFTFAQKVKTRDGIEKFVEYLEKLDDNVTLSEIKRYIK